jgi:16S rRNA (guanine527-N7)-methyltransferase
MGTEAERGEVAHGRALTMPTNSPTPKAIAELLQPYIGAAAIPSAVYSQLASYLQVILKWNSRLNLTAIREPEEIVRRHFGESLFAGLHLGSCVSLLDLGSGAGFPGIPIQLLRPELPVTLAESRARKAAFLHEVIRTLNLGTEVWAHRAEAMAANRRFHTVALRAVDEMDLAIAEAARRAEDRILILGTRGASYPTLPNSFQLKKPIPLPNSSESVLWIAETVLSSAAL